MSSRDGRCFTAGFGLAAAYIEDHLHAWGVKPAGDHGSYLQTVRVLGVKTTSHSTRQRHGQRRDAHLRRRRGDHLSEEHGRQAALHRRSRRVCRLRPRRAGRGPHGLQGQGRQGRRGHLARHQRAEEHRSSRSIAACSTGRNRYATEQLGAAASIGPLAEIGAGRAGRRGGAGAGAAAPAAGAARRFRPPTSRPCSGSTRRSRRTSTPTTRSSTFLFSQAPTKYDELKRKASAQEDLPSFRVAGATITFNVDADYQIVRTQLTQNVVAHRSRAAIRS